MIIITKKRYIYNINHIKYIIRVYATTTSKNNQTELKNIDTDTNGTSVSTDNKNESIKSQFIDMNYLKSNLNKAFYFTSTTLNRLYLRDSFLEKLNNSINSSRNYINETITNAITTKDDIKKTIEKLDKNKNEVLGNVKINNTNRNIVDLSKVKVKTNELVKTHRVIEDQTRFLCKQLKKSSSILIKTLYIEALCKHLYENIEGRNIIFDENIDKYLFELKNQVTDKNLNGNINECLALLGIINMERKRGINILSLDGGGAKGFVTIEILKNIEEKTGKRIYELFDYICGTSTGAILACLLSVYKITLDECESNYKKFVKEIFERNTAAGISNLLMTHAWYDSKLWEKLLREAMGDKLVIQSARDNLTPKLSVVSSVTTPNHMKVFLFRNYNLPLNQQSHYDGTHKYSVWQAVRASSAAPGYYEDFKIEGYIFHDGGVLANNPTAIALHESKQLWPNEELQCVISVGNGRFQPVEYLNKCDSLSIKQRVNRIVGGATSTENVHTVLHDLLPPKVYFRFNPYMSEEFHLDENRSEKWHIMQHDTQMYMRRNDYKFEIAAKQLLQEKTSLQKLNGFIKQKFNTISKNVILKSYINH